MGALAQVQTTVSREVSRIGQDLVALLMSWLNGLIFLFDTNYLLLTYFEIPSLPETSSGMQLRTRVAGEMSDATRHEGRYLARGSGGRL